MEHVLQRSFKVGTTTQGQSQYSQPRVVDIINHYVVQPHTNRGIIGQSQKGRPIPYQGEIARNIAKTTSDRRDIKNILAMAPNAELAIDIVVNGTLSPNNTLESELTYKSSYDKLGGVKAELLQMIRDAVEENIELNDKLPTIMREAKYEVGSYSILVIPTGRIRELIAATKETGVKATSAKLESVISDITGFGKTSKKSSRIGVSSTAKLFKFENAQLVEDNDGRISIHEDLSVLRTCQLRNKLRENRHLYGVLDELEDYSTFKPEAPPTMESSLSSKAIAESLTDYDTGFGKTHKRYEQDDVLFLHDLGVTPNDVDMATVMTIPHESIFVVHSPGDVTKHLGYFIAIDSTGNPVSIEHDLNNYQPMNNNPLSNAGALSSIGGISAYNTGSMEMGMGFGNGYDVGQNNHSNDSALFTALMEEELVNRVKLILNGGEDISISEHTDLMSTMFSRYLANKLTQIIFVPSTLLTYFAFEYDEYGNGQSLIIKHKNIGILNSVLTLANTNAAINNSIDYKEVRVTFDDLEIDPNKTIEQVMTNLTKYSIQSGQNLLQSDVMRQYDFIARSGYQFAFDEHAAMPGTKVEINNLDRERTEPDVDLQEKNEALLIQGLGSTPEVVDMARNVEFATSYFQSNLQAARNAIANQKKLTSFTDKLVRSFVFNSPALLKDLIKIIDKNRKEYPELNRMKTIHILREFILSVTTHLPKPDMVKVDLLDNAITQYEKLVDHLVTHTIGEEVFDGMDVGDELADRLENVRKKVKSLMMLDYIASNNMFADNISRALYTNDQEEIDNVMTRIESNQQFIINVLKNHDIISSTMVRKAEEELEAMRNAKDLDGEGGGGSDSSDSFSSGDDGGDDSSTDDDSSGGDPFEAGDGGDESDPFATDSDADDPF